MHTIIAFGTFDLLHEGHLFFLREASKLGKELVVVVARDSTVEEVKGKRPNHSEQERRSAVEKLSFVNRAVLGKESGGRFEIVKEIGPDVIAMGYDQLPSDEEVLKGLEKAGVQAGIVRIPAFEEHKFKTSIIKKNGNGPNLN
ncbi:MAG: FAD synthase [archaeon]|jgi:FAD synthetase|nr:FAD synthase [archaeon]